MLTALIALALFADNRELMLDPDKTWGVASRELLGPGLTGLMLACLLAALMSSVDAYMIVGSGLMVRNIYAPYINPDATEAKYIMVARMTGVLVVGGAVIISLFYMNVFQQLQLTWVFPVLFAAPFWVGMYWRKATRTAAWITVAFCVSTFFLIPFLAPRLSPSLRTNPRFLVTNEIVRTTTARSAAPSDVTKRDTQIAVWEESTAALLPRLGLAQEAYAEARDAADQDPSRGTQRLEELKRALDELESGERKTRPASRTIMLGDRFTTTKTSGGQGVFWPGGVKPYFRPSE